MTEPTKIPPWNILDSTKISDYQRCHRLHFFKHILGWRPEAESVDLVHGKAWHKAMKHLAHHKPYTDPKVLLGAYEEYLAEYRRGFPDDTGDIGRHPKQPGSVPPALAGYALEYNEEDERAKTLYTEIGGTVMLTTNTKIHFKIDSILQDERGIFSREHKTASRQSEQWRNRWRMATQIGTYHHVLCCLYPPEEVWGVEINGSFWHKNDTVFERMPVRRKLEMLEAWRVNTVNWIDMILDDIFKLERASALDDAMPIFTQNPESCSDYYGCPYLNLCLAWPNPLARCEEPPIGFKVEFWDPTEIELDEVVSL